MLLSTPIKKFQWGIHQWNRWYKAYSWSRWDGGEVEVADLFCYHHSTSVLSVWHMVTIFRIS